VKEDMNNQLKEHHMCLEQVIQNIAELESLGGNEADVDSNIRAFMAVSGSKGTELLNQQFYGDIDV